MRRLVSALVALVIVDAIHATAQEYFLVHGKVTDATTGGGLPYVSVRVEGGSEGTSADAGGVYSLRLRRGSHKLLFSSVGYRRQSVTIEAGKEDTVRCDVRLVSVSLMLDEVVVQGTIAPIVTLPSVGGVMLSPADLKHVGGAFGDVFRSLQGFVGVTSNDETSSQLNVRGGSAGENLVLLNGTQMFEPFHLKDAPNSSLTIFNTALLKRILVIPGGFPARYGDRLSAVVDLEYREGNGRSLEGTLDASLSDVGATVEGPLSGSLTALLNARTTYSKNIARYVIQGEHSQPSFYDVQGVLNWGSSETGRSKLFFLHSRDWTVGLSEGSYGADCASFSGTYGMGPRLQMDATISWYRQKDDLKRSPVIESSLRETSNDGGIAIGEAKMRLTMETGERSVLIGGIDVQRHSYDVRQSTSYTGFGGDSIVAGRLRTMYVAAGSYVENIVPLSPKLVLNAGARADVSWLTREFYLSPRAILNYHPDSLTTVTASYGWYTQFATHQELLAASIAAASPQRAQQARHYVLGYSRLIRRDMTFRVETYLKDIESLIPYRRLQGGELIFSPVNTGRARSYGVDFEASFSDQQVMGWVNFGVLVAKEQLGPDGQWQYRPTDQRRTITAVFEYRGIPRTLLNLRAYYGSGFAYTDNSPGTEFYFRKHYPEYKRIDVRLSYELQVETMSPTVFVEVLNIFSHRNVLSFTERGENPSYPDANLLLGRVVNVGVHLEFR